MSFQDYLKETTLNLVEQIKKHLYEENDANSWNEYVDRQEIGNCQSIVAGIVHDYPTVKKVFGEIEIDEPYTDEDGKEQTLMTHHWVTINGKNYDFSKGTLKDYIHFDDIYDPEVSPDEEYRYHDF